MIGGALELLGACTWHQYGPILLRMKTWKNPSTFCHSNMVQTSSKSGAPRSQVRFQVFFGGKIGLQDSGLRGFAWALGCGRTIKNFILKNLCLCWDRIQVFMSECWKFHFKTRFENICIFFWWCSALRVSFSDFNFLKVLISQRFHFRFQCESFVWELVFPFLRWPFWKFSFLRVVFFPFLRWPFSELPFLRVSTSNFTLSDWDFPFLTVYISASSVSDFKLSTSFHYWESIVSF